MDKILYNGKELLSPKLDIVFKNLFGVEDSKESLMHFLNNVLDMNIANTNNITLTNTELVPENHDGKLSRLDICLTVENDTKEHINIEIQLRNEHNIMKRSMFYLAKLYSGQLEQGKDYDELNKSVCVIILDYEHFDDERWMHKSRPLDIETYVEFSDCMEMVVIEIPKLPKDISLIKDKRQLWVMLLNVTTEEDLKVLVKENPEIAIVVDKLERISSDTEFQHQALVREKTIRDHYSSLSTAERRGLEKGEAIGLEKGEAIGLEKGEAIGLEKGEAIGLEKGRLERNTEIAKNMLLDNEPIEKIIMYTNLTELEIYNLKSQL